MDSNGGAGSGKYTERREDMIKLNKNDLNIERWELRTLERVAWNIIWYSTTPQIRESIIFGIRNPVEVRVWFLVGNENL